MELKTDHYLRILHLEDNTYDAELTEAHLKLSAIPCSITRAATEDVFEAALEASPIDVIISDSSLPGFDTFHALSRVRETHPDIPFIFLSGNASPRIKEQALTKGAMDYISKDCLPQLLTTIREVYRSKNRKLHGLPPVGKMVIAQCQGFRCMAILESDGTWKDFLQHESLPEVIEWFAVDD